MKEPKETPRSRIFAEMTQMPHREPVCTEDDLMGFSKPPALLWMGAFLLLQQSRGHAAPPADPGTSGTFMRKDLTPLHQAALLTVVMAVLACGSPQSTLSPPCTQSALLGQLYTSSIALYFLLSARYYNL